MTVDGRRIAVNIRGMITGSSENSSSRCGGMTIIPNSAGGNVDRAYTDLPAREYKWIRSFDRQLRRASRRAAAGVQESSGYRRHSSTH
jgi:hypothetical protein